MPQLITYLWFDTQAEQAARFYTSVFKDGTLGDITRYPATGQEVHGMPAGTVMTAAFEILGRPFVALNGGPVFGFTEATSIMVECDTQAEVDYFWDRLSEGGDPAAQQCGWLKDRFGFSWQVTPRGMNQYLVHPDRERSERAFAAMLQMKKLDMAELERAFNGE